MERRTFNGEDSEASQERAATQDAQVADLQKVVNQLAASQKNIQDTLVALLTASQGTPISDPEPARAQPAVHNQQPRTTNGVTTNTGINNDVLEGTGAVASLQDMVAKMLNEQQEKMIKLMEQQDKKTAERISQIPGAPPVRTAIDIERYKLRPYKESAAPVPIPKSFKMPIVQKYNGMTDPTEHVEAP